MSILDQFNTIVAALEQAEAEIGDVWVHPGLPGSLIFANSETGEILDAVMRADGRFSRNNAKSSMIENEIADAAMMVVRAIMVVPGYKGTMRNVLSRQAANVMYDEGACEVGNHDAVIRTTLAAQGLIARAWRQSSTEDCMKSMSTALIFLLSFDFDVAQVVTDRIARIKRRIRETERTEA